LVSEYQVRSNSASLCALFPTCLGRPRGHRRRRHHQRHHSPPPPRHRHEPAHPERVLPNAATGHPAPRRAMILQPSF